MAQSDDDRRVAGCTVDKFKNGGLPALLPFVHSAANGRSEPIVLNAARCMNDRSLRTRSFDQDPENSSETGRNFLTRRSSVSSDNPFN
jgi:hypothetical protein